MTKEINSSRVTIKVLEQMKSKGEKISMLTAYDYSFAKIIDDVFFIWTRFAMFLVRVCIYLV